MLYVYFALTVKCMQYTALLFLSFKLWRCVCFRLASRAIGESTDICTMACANPVVVMDTAGTATR